MKGIIFNLFEQFLTAQMGEERVQQLLQSPSLKTREPFVGPGTYPDEDFVIMLGAAVDILGTTQDAATRSFGRFSFSRLASRYPQFVAAHKDPKLFLKTVDSIIHVEVRKLYTDAQLPQFVYNDPASDRLIIEYRSHRRLCHFMEGLIEGVADHFKSPIRYQQNRCVFRGDDLCTFDLQFGAS